MMRVEQLVDSLPEEAKVLGENLSKCRFLHHKSQLATNCLGYIMTLPYTSSTSALTKGMQLRALAPRWQEGLLNQDGSDSSITVRNVWV
jgi:hypothetical protein